MEHLVDVKVAVHFRLVNVCIREVHVELLHTYVRCAAAAGQRTSLELR